MLGAQMVKSPKNIILSGMSIQMQHPRFLVLNLIKPSFLLFFLDGQDSHENP